MTTLEKFEKIIRAEVGTKRECNDGSGEDCFVIEESDVESLANRINVWFEEEKDDDYNYEYEDLENYFDETYPLA